MNSNRPAGIAACLLAAVTGLSACAADPAAGAAGREALGSRFRWLTAPRSTVVHPGPVHTGLTEDPDAQADRLLRVLFLPVAR